MLVCNRDRGISLTQTPLDLFTGRHTGRHTGRLGDSVAVVAGALRYKVIDNVDQPSPSFQRSKKAVITYYNLIIRIAYRLAVYGGVHVLNVGVDEGPAVV